MVRCAVSGIPSKNANSQPLLRNHGEGSLILDPNKSTIEHVFCNGWVLDSSVETGSAGALFQAHQDFAEWIDDGAHFDHELCVRHPAASVQNGSQRHLGGLQIAQIERREGIADIFGAQIFAQCLVFMPYKP